MHPLRRQVQGVAVGLRIVQSDGAARLHRARRDTVVHQVERNLPIGFGERPVRRLGVAGLPVQGDVPLRLGPEHGRAVGHRLGHAGHGGQFRIVDDDGFGGIARKRQTFSDHHGHDLARVAYLVIGHQRTRRCPGRLAVGAAHTGEAG